MIGIGVSMARSIKIQAGAGAVVFFQDNFNRADNASTLGEPWLTSGTWGINGNEAYCVGDGLGEDWAVNPDVGAANYVLSCDMRSDFTDEVNHRVQALSVRQSDPFDRLVIMLRVDGIYLRKHDSVSQSYPDLGFWSETMVSGTVYRIKVKCLNNNIEVSKNGQVIITHTLSTEDNIQFGTAPGCGLYVYKMGNPTNPTRFDTFVVSGVS